MPREMASEELPYIVAIVLWLAGVVVIIARKLVA